MTELLQFKCYFPFTIMAKFCLHRNRLIDIENRLVVAGSGGGEEGEGWTGSLAFVDANYTFTMYKQQGPNM